MEPSCNRAAAGAAPEGPSTPPAPPAPHFPSPYAPPSQAPTQCRMVTMTDGVGIAAFVYGDVRSPLAPVLMLHGNGEEHRIFGPIVDAVIEGGHPVVAIDTRGQGKSEWGEATLSYELFASDALAVLDAYEIPAAHVLGFSDGGIEALLMARDHPERVASLTVLGANLTPEGVIEDDEWDIAGAVAANRAWASFWEGSTSPVRADLLSPTPTEAARTADLLDLMLREPHIPAESLSAISCPTTIMVGEFDCIDAAQTEAICAAIAGSRLVVVDEIGHNLPKQAPDAVSSELLATIAASHPKSS